MRTGLEPRFLRRESDKRLQTSFFLGPGLWHMSLLHVSPAIMAENVQGPRVLGRPFSLAELCLTAPLLLRILPIGAASMRRTFPSPPRGKKRNLVSNSESSCCGMPPMLHTVHIHMTALRVPATYSENGCKDTCRGRHFRWPFAYGPKQHPRPYCRPVNYSAFCASVVLARKGGRSPNQPYLLLGCKTLWEV